MFAPLLAPPPLPKVALCFLISYEQVLAKEAVWREWIAQNADLFNVYFHCKEPALVRSPWVRRHAIPKKFTAETTYYKVVSGYFSIMSYAFKHDPGNRWFCLLTDTCAPVVHPAYFRSVFEAHAHQSIIRCKPAYWNIDMHKRANLRHLSKEYHLANDPWFILTREHVRQCTLFVMLKQPTYNLICEGGLANESLFAIILQTFGHLGGPSIVNEMSTVADWVRMSTPTSPYVFKDATPENLRVIGDLIRDHPMALFARKIHRSFPDAALRDIIYGENPPVPPVPSVPAWLFDAAWTAAVMAGIVTIIWLAEAMQGIVA